MPAATHNALVLGIETSCDETAAAVVSRTPDGRGRIVAEVLRAQWEEHRAFGGVVPEIAARAHAECLDEVIRLALKKAGIGLPALDAIAAAAGPGLIGGLLVGLTAAKALALALKKPLIAVNHLEAHALTVGLTDGVKPPYLLLLVSGGHTQILRVDGVGRYVRLGTTIDDALGEAFDKTAKLIGLPQPGGPAIEEAAKSGRADRFPLPRPLIGRPEPNFSFAGLKTAVRQAWEALPAPTEADQRDLAASFQAAVIESVADRVRRAIEIEAASLSPSRVLVIAGGVAANRQLKERLERVAAGAHYRLVVPPIRLCTDNGVMIAWAGAERLALGLTVGLEVTARPRWPLDATAAPVLGSGKHGAKA